METAAAARIPGSGGVSGPAGHQAAFGSAGEDRAIGKAAGRSYDAPVPRGIAPDEKDEHSVDWPGGTIPERDGDRGALTVDGIGCGDATRHRQGREVAAAGKRSPRLDQVQEFLPLQQCRALPEPGHRVASRPGTGAAPCAGGCPKHRGDPGFGTGCFGRKQPVFQRPRGAIVEVVRESRWKCAKSLFGVADSECGSVARTRR